METFAIALMVISALGLVATFAWAWSVVALIYAVMNYLEK